MSYILSRQSWSNEQSIFYLFYENAFPTNMEPHYPQIEDLIFSINGIENVLNNLSLNKSPGPDNISNFILKLCSSIIAPILQVIFTQSFNDHILPTDWLMAYIKSYNRREPYHIINSCLHWKGSRNLQIIDLFLTCCKIMEHVIFHHVMGHLNKNNIINKHQHGFRPSHSCQSQLLLLTEDILKAMDSKKQVDHISWIFVNLSTKYHIDDFLINLSTMESLVIL